MRGARGRRAAAVAVVAVAVVSGCGSPVALDAPPPVPACESLAAALPDRVAGQERRRTEPEAPTTAAWGDPPISLRCGGATPAAYAPGAQLLSVNGTDWLPEELSAGVRFWLIGAPVVVEVTVPDAYAPEAGVIAELSPAITKVAVAPSSP